MILHAKYRSAIALTALLSLAATGPVHAQLFQTNTADQIMQDAEQRAASDPKAACIGFTEAANLYRSLSQDATRQANAIPANDPASRKMELNRVADDAMRGELTARNRASQVCSLTPPPEPKEKPKS